MENGFLALDSKKANKKKRKVFLSLFIVFIVLITLLVFLLKDQLDWKDDSSKGIVIIGGVFAAFMLLITTYQLIQSLRVVTKGKNLILPLQEDTKEAVGKIIDQEIAEQKIQVDEYIDEKTRKNNSYGERVMLIPSYLLLFNGMGKIKAIPQNKICWICSQIGRQGESNFIVRLLIFTETKMLYIDGADVEHMQSIADKIYHYIPNIFAEYDPFVLSYELEKVFKKDPKEFIALCEAARTKSTIA